MVGSDCRTAEERKKLTSFRKVSKPLMEKKRRARINLSLEQLKVLLEKHFSHQIQKRKLEKADILELSVKYMKSLQCTVRGPPGLKNAEYQAGFRSCLQGVRQFLLRPESTSEVSALQLLRELAQVLPGVGGSLSTTDSDIPPGLGEVPAVAPGAARRTARPHKFPAQAGERAFPSRGGRSVAIGGQPSRPAFLERSPQLWRPW